MTTKMKPPAGVLAGMGAGGATIYVQPSDPFVHVDDTHVASLLAAGWTKVAHEGDVFDPSSVAIAGGTIANAPVSRIPYVLSQSGIAMILPSSGSIGNNGALTLTTAIPLSGGYAWGCYMYFPAGAISAGSAAGLYFVIMSSNNAGTIYNNVYTSGTPTIPDTPVPFVTTGPGAYTQVLTTVNLSTVTVPANSMGRNGALTHRPSWIFPNNANNKSVSTAFGASLVYAKTRSTAALEAPLVDIQNEGVANRQVSSWGTTAGPVTSSSATPVNLAVDTTADVSLVCSGLLTVATDFIILTASSVTIHPFP